MYFECHVTLAADVRPVAEVVGRKHGFHWSQIDGDEVMGPGPRGYLTRSAVDGAALETSMRALCAELGGVAVQWSRRKIENIILDERQQA